MDPKTQEQKREALILGAAMDVFIEKGKSGTRMQEIADRAGLSKTLLHYYFRSKENIYAKILETVFTGFLSRLESAFTSGGSFEEVLRTFISLIMDFLSKNPRLPLFMLHELSQGGKTVTGIWTSMMESGRFRLPERMISLIGKEIEAGRLRPVNPIQFMVTLLGACIYYFMAEPIFAGIADQLFPGTYDRDSFIEERKQAVIDVLFNGIMPRANETGTAEVRV